MQRLNRRASIVIDKWPFTIFPIEVDIKPSNCVEWIDIYISSVSVHHLLIIIIQNAEINHLLTYY